MGGESDAVPTVLPDAVGVMYGVYARGSLAHKSATDVMWLAEERDIHLLYYV